jgi:hypothetical protein
VKRRDSTLRPPPLPAGLAVDVLSPAVHDAIGAAVQARLLRLYATAFVVGGVGAICGTLTCYAMLRMGWL